MKALPSPELSAGPCTHLQSHVPGTKCSQLLWAFGGTSGFTFLSLRAQFSTLDMSKIQAQYKWEKVVLFFLEKGPVSVSSTDRSHPWGVLGHSQSTLHGILQELRSQHSSDLLAKPTPQRAPMLLLQHFPLLSGKKWLRTSQQK